MDQDESPLYGLKWNEAEADKQFYHGLITILAFGRDGKPNAIGTGFIIKSEGKRAVAITAAHVLAEVRRLQTGEPKHHHTALPMFLPPVKPIDIDPKKLRALHVGEGVEAFIVEGLAFDERSDIAILTLAPQNSESADIPLQEFMGDDTVPPIGSLVCVLSYGDLSAKETEEEEGRTGFKVAQRPVLRVGRVLAHHLDGHRLCKGPCIETSIPVFSGMSGGPVFPLSDKEMKPIGLVCSDPDEDGPQKHDRSFEGASIIALLPSKVQKLEGGSQVFSLHFFPDQFAGKWTPPSAG